MAGIKGRMAWAPERSDEDPGGTPTRPSHSAATPLEYVCRTRPCRPGGSVGPAEGGRGAFLSIGRDVGKHNINICRPGEAERPDAMLTLSAGVAHELTGMLLAAGLCLQQAEAGAGGAAPCLARAGVLVQQARTLSAALLELLAVPGSPAGGGVPLLAIDRWLPECLARLAEVLPSGVSVAAGPIGALPPVWADPVGLELVLRILTGNASEALGGGGVIRLAVAVTGRRVRRGVEIRVIDEGPGIPEADRERLFEPGFTTRSRPGRSGLGLSLAKRLVDSMGGTLFHEARTPTGSIFVVRLRVAPPGSAP
jgi:signal transduction histidine kinase